MKTVPETCTNRDLALSRDDRPNREGGFTILEIMIATAILTLGLVGILALFPVAIYSGKQVVERSTAVVIAESVAEEIREGLRNQLRYSPAGDAYFIFKHDGVTSNPPAARDSENSRDDYYILLPKFRRKVFSGRRARENALKAIRTFCYPETDRPRNGNGRERRADDDGNDHVVTFSNGEKYADVLVTKTYKIGRFLPTMDDKDALDDQKVDSLKQYSYAFTISPSVNDANGSLSASKSQFQPAGRLYHVHIMVFRAFPNPFPDDGEPQIPVFDLDFEVSI